MYNNNISSVRILFRPTRGLCLYGRCYGATLREQRWRLVVGCSGGFALRQAVRRVPETITSDVWTKRPPTSRNESVFKTSAGRGPVADDGNNDRSCLRARNEVNWCCIVTRKAIVERTEKDFGTRERAYRTEQRRGSSLRCLIVFRRRYCYARPYRY